MRKKRIHPRTELLNKEQKKQSLKARDETLNWLIQTFPEAFCTASQIRPLKIGIEKDIFSYLETRDLTFSRAKIREVLAVFTRRIDYLSCLKAQEMRIDLWGQEVSRVTLEESNSASLKIKKQVEKMYESSGKVNANDKEHSTARLCKPLKVEKNEKIVKRVNVINSNKQQKLPAATTTSIIIKRTPKTFDPNMVARLKEKLGIS